MAYLAAKSTFDEFLQALSAAHSSQIAHSVDGDEKSTADMAESPMDADLRVQTGGAKSRQANNNAGNGQRTTRSSKKEQLAADHAEGTDGSIEKERPKGRSTRGLPRKHVGDALPTLESILTSEPSSQIGRAHV